MWRPAPKAGIAPSGNSIRTFVLYIILQMLVFFGIYGAALADIMPDAAPRFASVEIELQPAVHKAPVRFMVKLAETETQRSYGLMHTPYLPDRHGMLFVFDTAALRQFWMKNTQIPLDLLFFDADGMLVNIIHSATPFSLTPRVSAGPARYVLEINGGQAANLGVRASARLILPLPVPSNRQ